MLRDGLRCRCLIITSNSDSVFGSRTSCQNEACKRIWEGFRSVQFANIIYNLRLMIGSCTTFHTADWVTDKVRFQCAWFWRHGGASPVFVWVFCLGPVPFLVLLVVSLWRNANLAGVFACRRFWWFVVYFCLLICPLSQETKTFHAEFSDLFTRLSQC